MHLTALIEGRRSRVDDQQHVIEVTITNDRAETVYSLVKPIPGPDKETSVWWQAKAVVAALTIGVPSWAWPTKTAEDLVRLVQDRVYDAHTRIGHPVSRLSVDLSDRPSDDLDDLDERISAIEAMLTERVDAYMAEHLPSYDYEFDVFDSDNGDDDWVAPLACNLAIEELGVDDAYGLCDAGTGTVEEQVDFLFAQVIEELQAALKANASGKKEDFQ